MLLFKSQVKHFDEGKQHSKWNGPYTIINTSPHDEITIKDDDGNIFKVNCNTLGVCHQLSNGFELNHDMFSGDGDVKVKPMVMSPNLNSDIAPLLYI